MEVSALRVQMLVTMTTGATFVAFSFLWYAVVPDAPFPLTLKAVSHFLLEKIGDVGEIHAIALLLSIVIWIVQLAVKEMVGAAKR